MQKSETASQRLRRALENPTAVDLIEMGKAADRVSVDGGYASLKMWPRAFSGLGSPGISTLFGSRESETAKYTHTAIARFPEGRAIVQVRDNEGLRGYRASAVGEDVTVDLSDATDEALPAALKDLIKIEITSGQGANRHTVDVDVGVRKTHELLAFTAEHDPYQKLRVVSNEDHLILQVRAQAYDSECMLPHVQDTLGGGDCKMRVRINTDDPQVLAQVGSAWSSVRKQVEDMRGDLGVIHPLQEGETVDVSLPSKMEGRFLARHLGFGDGESKIIFPRNKGSYTVGDAGVELKESSLRAEMLHHVLDVAVGGKGFDDVGAGTRIAYHELFDDLRMAGDYPVEEREDPFFKKHLLAYMLPARSLPGIEVEGHYIIRGGTDGGILVNAVKGLRREGEVKEGELSGQEVQAYKFLLGMNLEKQPPLLQVGLSVFEPQVDNAVMDAYREVGMQPPANNSRGIVSYSPVPLSSYHAGEMLSGIGLPEDRTAEYMVQARNIKEEFTGREPVKAEAGQDLELAATAPKGGRMTREQMEALADRNRELLVKAVGEVCDLETLEASVTDYARLVTLHHIASHSCSESQDFILIQEATEKDPARNAVFQQILGQEKEPDMWYRLAAMEAMPYDADTAKQYFSLRRQLFQTRSDALKKANADGPETVRRLEEYDTHLDGIYKARLGIIETQDRLEANLASPESGLAYTTRMPDGEERVFATQLHYMHELMKGYAQGQYSLLA